MTRGTSRGDVVVVPSARAMRLIRSVPAAEALVAIGFMSFVDYPTRVRVGGSSLSALITMAVLALLVVILVMNLVIATCRSDRGSRRALSDGLRHYPALLVLFAVYAGVRLAMSPTSEAIQNVMCYLMFVLCPLVVVTSLRFDYRRVGRLMAWAGVASAAVYLCQQLFLTSGDVDRPLISDRAFAITALVTLAVMVPRRSGHGDSQRPPQSIVWPLFIVVVLVVSLSRTALGVAFALLLFFAVRAPAKVRLPAVIAASVTSVLALVMLVAAYPPILSRFTEGDNAQVGGIAVNTSGRSQLWSITYDSAMRAPIWGHGPGNAKIVVQQFFAIPGTDHPHNDYLRIFNDLGVIGVVLFWGGVLLLLARLCRLAIRYDQTRHWSAVMGVLSVVLVAATDNVIVYQFIMVPVGVLVGIALRPDPGPVPMTAGPSPSPVPPKALASGRAS